MVYAVTTSVTKTTGSAVAVHDAVEEEELLEYAEAPATRAAAETAAVNFMFAVVGIKDLFWGKRRVECERLELV